MRLPTVRTFLGLLGFSLIFLPTYRLQAAPEVSATATTAAVNLDLDGTGNANTHIVKVADISLSTINSTGLKLEIPIGHLVEEENRMIAFQVTTVPNNADIPNSSAFTNKDYSYSTSVANAEERDVYIKYATQVSADPGNYSANIQFMVTDNP